MQRTSRPPTGSARPPVAGPAVQGRPRSALVLTAASVAGLMMLCWPLLLRAPEGGRVDPQFLFLALLPLVIVVVLAEFSEGGMDARVLAASVAGVALLAALRRTRNLRRDASALPPR